VKRDALQTFIVVEKLLSEYWNVECRDVIIIATLALVAASSLLSQQSVHFHRNNHNCRVA